MVVTALLLLVTAVTSRTPCGGGEGRGWRPEGRGWWTAEDGSRFPPGCSWLSADDVRVGCLGRTKPCLWKCCPQGQLMDQQLRCVNRTHSLSLDTSWFHLLSPTTCSNRSFIVTAKDDNFTVLRDGFLWLRVPEEHGLEEEYEPGTWCYEVVVNTLTYFACFAEHDVDKQVAMPAVKFIINSTGMIVSLPFLLATLFVYASIPELRNLHGKCLISHVSSLAAGFSALIVIQLGQLPPRALSKTVCIASGYSAYFFLLASFLWLHVMCFDIWWTFSGFSNKVGLINQRDSNKFLHYSLYAWGSAVVALCVCVVMQFSPGVPKHVPRPHFGEITCWFNGINTEHAAAQWLYFNGPVGLLIASNIFFFVHTALGIVKIRRQTAVLYETPDNQMSQQHLRFQLYLKLFVIMGVSWSMEIISTAIGGPDAIWWVTDLANVLVGIPIFVIFVWKSKTRQLFIDKMSSKLYTRKLSTTTGIELTTNK